MISEPLTPSAAKALIVRILTTGGTVSFRKHALDEMEIDGISEQQVFTVLRGGVVEPAEFRSGSWRYRVRAGRTYAVVAFRSENWTVVVTAWKVKP